MDPDQTEPRPGSPQEPPTDPTSENTGGTDPGLDPRAYMGFGDHLEDLRRRLVLGFLGVVPIFAVSLYFGRPLMGLLMSPLLDALRRSDLPAVLQQTAPLEGIYTYLKLSIVITVLLGAPWLIYQLWRFVSPGLYTHERKFVTLLVPMSGLLTILSVAFLYFLVLPVILGYLIYFGTHIVEWPVETTPAAQLPDLGQIRVLPADPDAPEPGTMWVNERLRQLRIAMDAGGGEVKVMGVPLTSGTGVQQQYKLSDYVNTVLSLALAFGAGFQMPIVVLLLGWSGIVERASFAKHRRPALAVCFVLGAVLTPADPLSMLLLAIPLYGLYELGVLLLTIFKPGYERLREQAEAEEARAEQGGGGDGEDRGAAP